MDKQQNSAKPEYKSIGPKSAYKKENLRKRIKEKAYIKRKIQDKLEKYIQIEMDKSTKRIEALEDLVNSYLNGTSRRDSIMTNPQTEAACQMYIEEFKNPKKNLYKRRVINC